MTILTHLELNHLLDAGIIRGAHKAHVNGASIDLTLGSKILVESSPNGAGNIVDLMDKAVPAMREVDLLPQGYYDLAPLQFCLASTVEMFYLPDDLAAEFKLKSSLARAGLNHALAGFADPGWTGSVLTLELTNSLRWHSLRLRPGQKIGQMVFFRGAAVPDHASYRVTGAYNGDTSAQPSKGLR
jgi:deoxycytidine triphosphate deaminase